jgi:hypothetical protein
MKATTQLTLGYSLAIMLSSLWSVPAFAQDSPGTAAFKRLDKNGDGKITRDEAPGPDGFNAADADKDGAVTPEEFRRYLDARQRPQAPRPAPPPSTTTSVPTPAPVDGKPVFKSIADADAVRDAAGTGQLFECVHVPGLTDIRKGINGFAIADLNRDGLPDFIAAVSPPVSLPDGLGAASNVERVSRRTAVDQLLVLVNEGGFRFRSHALRIRDSKLTQERFESRAQVPNLADFNGDGFLDIFITRHSPMTAGQNRANLPLLGNTLLVSDGAWDQFVDLSESMGARNELAYNRQSSIGDVNQDGWLDIAIGCDNIGNAMGGVPHSRLYLFRPGDNGFSNGRFEDIGDTDRIPDFGGFHHDSARDKAGPNLALRDIDGDGDLDLLQSCHVDVREPLLPYTPGEYRQGVFCWKNLLSETGDARFEKITGNSLAVEARLKFDREKQEYVPQGKAPGLAYLVFADVDNDGLPDALAVGPNSPRGMPRCEDVSGRFWKNLGVFQFAEKTSAAGLDALNFRYREWFAFFDQESRARPALTDRHPYYADAIFGDFDNDGWQDLLVLDRREIPGLGTRAMLWMNHGNGTFEVKRTEFSGLDGSGISGEAADLDGDGLLDLFFAADPDNTGIAVDISGYESKVYWNTGGHGGKENHWLHLTFTGISHAELIGARIELTADGRKQFRWIHTNHSYKSGGALDAHFGLGKATTADVKVTLLNGKTRTFEKIAADKSHPFDFRNP